MIASNIAEPAAAKAIHASRRPFAGAAARACSPLSRLGIQAAAAHRMANAANPPDHIQSCVRVASLGSIQNGYAANAASAAAFDSANKRYGRASAAPRAYQLCTSGLVAAKRK